MGKKDEAETIVSTIEDALGIDDELTTENNSRSLTNNKEEEQEENTNKKTEETFTGENEKPEKKTETPVKKETNTVTLTTEQVEINKEIATLDKEIEDLEKNSVVNLDEFYSTLDDTLTDEEQQLEHDDKPAYFKLLNKKKEEYINEHSNNEELKAKKAEKAEKEKVYERQSAIVEVTAEYPDYDHKEVMEFYQRKLSVEEQEKVYEGAESYVDVYRNTYKLMKPDTPPNVKSKEAPTIPDLNKVRKDTLSDTKVKESFDSEEDQAKKAIGL